MRRWRTLGAHQGVQAEGRRSVFADYRLRVASVVRDHGLHDREQAPGDSRHAHAAISPDVPSIGTSMGVGRGSGTALALGVTAGTLVWATAATLGLTALLATWVEAMSAIRIAGAAT